MDVRVVSLLLNTLETSLHVYTCMYCGVEKISHKQRGCDISNSAQRNLKRVSKTFVQWQRFVCTFMGFFSTYIVAPFLARLSQTICVVRVYGLSKCFAISKHNRPNVCHYRGFP